MQFSKCTNKTAQKSRTVKQAKAGSFKEDKANRTEIRSRLLVIEGPWLLLPQGPRLSAALLCSSHTNPLLPWRPASLDQWLQTKGTQYKQSTRAQECPMAVHWSVGVIVTHLYLQYPLTRQPANHLKAKLHSRWTEEGHTGWKSLCKNQFFGDMVTAFREK